MKPEAPEPRPHDLASRWVELSPADLAHRWRDRTILESVDEAVGDGRPDEEYVTPDAALTWLLRCTWYDLLDVQRQAVNGKWSIMCEHYVDRIVGLTSLVGPASWEHVPVDLILDGIYERIHERMGMPTPLTDDDRARAQAVKERNSV